MSKQTHPKVPPDCERFKEASDRYGYCWVLEEQGAEDIVIWLKKVPAVWREVIARDAEIAWRRIMECYSGLLYGRPRKPKKMLVKLERQTFTAAANADKWREWCDVKSAGEG